MSPEPTIAEAEDRGRREERAWTRLWWSNMLAWVRQGIRDGRAVIELAALEERLVAGLAAIDSRDAAPVGEEPKP